MQLASALESNHQLEYVQELSNGALGALWLARLATGPEIGRLVVARRIKIERLDLARLAGIVEAARAYGSLSHPALVKLLAVHRTQAELIWVEEQVIGVPLGKLQELVRSQQTAIPLHVAIKLVLDAVKASHALRRVCRDQNLPEPEQLIFPDTVMVANFGESLLAGVGVANEICHCPGIRQQEELTDVLGAPNPLGHAGERQEIYTAGAILWKLLAIPGLFENYGNQRTLDLVLHAKSLKREFAERLNLCAPKPVAQIIRQATTRNLSQRFCTLSELSAAIDKLPPQMVATDSQVRNWLSDVAGDYLSDVQRSSGVRRVPMNLRASSVPNAMVARPSYIPTPLPGFHQPLVPRVAPTETLPNIVVPDAPQAQPESAPQQASTEPVVALKRRPTALRVALIAALLGALLPLSYMQITHRIDLRVLIGKSSGRLTAGRGARPHSGPNSANTSPTLSVPSPGSAREATGAQLASPSPQGSDSNAEETNTSGHRRRGKSSSQAPLHDNVPGPNRWGI